MTLPRALDSAFIVNLIAATGTASVSRCGDDEVVSGIELGFGIFGSLLRFAELFSGDPVLCKLLICCRLGLSGGFKVDLNPTIATRAALRHCGLSRLGSTISASRPRAGMANTATVAQMGTGGTVVASRGRQRPVVAAAVPPLFQPTEGVWVR